MKKSLYISVFILLSSLSFGQNLAPNPSFEDFISTPNGLAQINLANGWTSYSKSPDYFHAAATFPYCAIPYNWFGFQMALDNNSAYAGLYTYIDTTGTGDPSYLNTREVIGSELIDSLIIGERYYVSLFVNPAYLSSSSEYHCFINNIGVRFSTQPYSVTSPISIDNFSHVLENNVISDTLIWTRISGSFIADSSYKYVAVGNFYDDQSTTIICDQTGSSSYYYVDQICVSIDSTLCIPEASVNEYELSFRNYPNPVLNELNIELFDFCQKVEIELYDMHGQILRTFTLDGNKLKLDVSELNPGIYLLNLRKDDNSNICKIIKL